MKRTRAGSVQVGDTLLWCDRQVKVVERRQGRYHIRDRDRDQVYLFVLEGEKRLRLHYYSGEEVVIERPT